MNVPSVLELIGIPYTGSPPLALGLCQNKGFAKDVLRARRIQTPPYQVLNRFEDWKGTDGKSHMGFKTLVLNQFSPEMASLLTGVPQETIVEIAQEFSSHRPSIAISGRGVGMQTNGTYSQMAIDSLMHWLGQSIHRGVYFSRVPSRQ
jgi:anaerobic selenocysteine-containing dehydrogenase